jgi:hypothetical protein
MVRSDAGDLALYNRGAGPVSEGAIGCLGDGPAGGSGLRSRQARCGHTVGIYSMGHAWRSAMAGLLLLGGLLGRPQGPAWSEPMPRPQLEECTIAVLTGKATADGRPILWKNRDAAHRENEVRYFDDRPYSYVALLNAGGTNHSWIGINERGLGVLNSLAYNLSDSLPEGYSNGLLMKEALRTCADVTEFEGLLRRSNQGGREHPANFAVIDAHGGARIFEDATHAFVVYDANDPSAAPNGFLARANFSISADTTGVNTARYHRCRRLLAEAVFQGGAGVDFLLQQVGRDLVTPGADPYPFPYGGAPAGYPGAVGYVDASETINRHWSVAGGAIMGVREGEDPRLSTFFSVVSHPAVTITLPVWVAAGHTPAALDGGGASPLCELAVTRARTLFDFPGVPFLLDTRRLDDGAGTGYLVQVEAIEGWLIPRTLHWIQRWREGGVSPEEMARAESGMAADAFEQYRSGTATPGRALQLASSPDPGSAHEHRRGGLLSALLRKSTLEVLGRKRPRLRDQSSGGIHLAPDVP